MQGIYTYIPETNSVAAILLLLFMVLISLLSVLNLLYFFISTFRSMCAVPNMAVFCSSLTSWFPGVLLLLLLLLLDVASAYDQNTQYSRALPRQLLSHYIFSLKKRFSCYKHSVTSIVSHSLMQLYKERNGCPVHSVKAGRWNGGLAPLILNPDTGWRGVVVVNFTSSFMPSPPPPLRPRL